MINLSQLTIVLSRLWGSGRLHTACPNTNQTAIIVAQAPGALSNISTAHDLPQRAKLKVLETEVKIPLRLYLAVRKDAPADVMRVVETAAAMGKP